MIWRIVCVTGMAVWCCMNQIIIHFFWSIHSSKRPFFFSFSSSNHPVAKSVVWQGINSSSDDLCHLFCLFLLLRIYFIVYIQYCTVGSGQCTVYTVSLYKILNMIISVEYEESRINTQSLYKYTVYIQTVNFWQPPPIFTYMGPEHGPVPVCVRGGGGGGSLSLLLLM